MAAPQKQWKYCTDLLEDIASGKQKLPLEEANPDREEASVAVIAPRSLFLTCGACRKALWRQKAERH